MTDAPPTKSVTTMPVGGAVMAIVPQSFEELQRVANQIIAGELAPFSLVKRPGYQATAEEAKATHIRNVAAVSGVLMAGAELGVPPMAALRLFTSINGRPALYADGNVAVVRKARDPEGSRIAKRIDSGVVIARLPDGSLDPDGTFGWCEAERADTGEIHREEFSVADAITAGLWDQGPEVERETWEDKPSGGRHKVKRKVQNDAPWFRFWKRMLLWRATGYCLRWLFADILGGMLDEYEARDIERMIDVTPQRPTPPTPPEPPEPPEPKGTIISGTSNEVSKDIANAAASDLNDDDSGVTTDLDIAAYLTRIDEELSSADTEDSVNELFDAADVQTNLAGRDEAIEQAFALRNRHLARVNGQGDLLGERS